MGDEELALAAAVWVKGRTAKAALVELWVMLVKLGGNQEAILRHLGMWPDEGGGGSNGQVGESAETPGQ